MTISRGDFWFFIIELVTRNPTMGIPALEDGLFANLLIVDYLYYILLCGLSASKMTLVFVDPFFKGFLLVHTLASPLQTQTHTQACGGGGGGGGGRGGGGSAAPPPSPPPRPPALPPPPPQPPPPPPPHACVCVYVCRGVSGLVFGSMS